MTKLNLPGAVAQAAAHTDMNVADNSAPVPRDDDHQRPAPADPDLSALTPQQRDQHHVRQLYAVVKHDGLNGVAAYVQRYPEAAKVVVKPNPATFIPKPPGYAAAVSQIVGGWLTEDGATERTNRQDVATLNAHVGGSRFNPNTYFSREFGERERERLAKVFAARGFALPADATTLSKVKKAAKAARAGTLPGAEAFGSIGTLSGGLMSIGGATFDVKPHGSHDCIRLNVNGDRVRLRVDAIREFLMLTGLLRDTGDTPFSSDVVSRRTGPQAQIGQDQPPAADSLPENWSRAATTAMTDPQSPGELVRDTLEMSFDELAAANAEAKARREYQKNTP